MRITFIAPCSTPQFTCWKFSIGVGYWILGDMSSSLSFKLVLTMKSYSHVWTANHHVDLSRCCARRMTSLSLLSTCRSPSPSARTWWATSSTRWCTSWGSTTNTQGTVSTFRHWARIHLTWTCNLELHIVYNSRFRVLQKWKMKF